MHIIPLQQCTPDMAATVGGKALGLGELLRAGLPVPPGVALTTQAYRESVAPIAEAIRIELQTPGQTPRHMAEHIDALFENLQLPADVAAAIEAAYLELCGSVADLPVAVRSSATAEDSAEASFAGQQETYLWVRGAAEVKRQVVHCWASLYGTRAIEYRTRMKVAADDLAMAVVIQRMVPAESAGVMMTLDPVSGDHSQIYIESAFGLGEIVVRGEVEPDRFRIDKQTFALQFEDIATKQHAYRFVEAAGAVQRVELPVAERSDRSLSAAEVIALGRLGRRIEEAFGRPMDIEWAIATNPATQVRELFMLQARPETVWSNRAAEEAPKDVIGRHDDWDPMQGSSAPGNYWTTTNVGEATPGVQSPLSWSTWGPISETSQREAAWRMGVFDAQERKVPADIHQYFNQAFYGRAALQVSYLAIMGDRMPGTTGPETVRSLFGRVPEDMAFHPTMRRYPVIIWRLITIFLTLPPKLKAFADEYTAWWQQSLLRVPRLDRDQAVVMFKEAMLRFTEANTTQILAVLSTVQPMFVFIERLAASSGVTRAAKLSSASGNAEMAVVCDLWRVSRGQMSIEEVVDIYGFHGPVEGELSSKVWREDDAPLRRMAAQYAKRDESHDPIARESRQQIERAAIEQEVLAAIPWWKRPVTRWMLKLARQYLPLRGVAKCSFLQGIDIMRASARRIGEHLVAEGLIDQVEDVFYLTVAELTGEFPADARRLVALRRARRAAYMKLSIPGNWEGMPEAVVMKADDVDITAVDTLHGIGVSRGVVEGRVRVVMNPDFADVEADEILVASTTDPSWSSIMFISSAIIVDIGGALSHAAVVARELNIPCVVNTRTGTTSLRTGDLVRVDGTSGSVHIIEREAGGQLPKKQVG